MADNETYAQLKKEAYDMFIYWWGNDFASQATFLDKFPLLTEIAKEYQEDQEKVPDPTPIAVPDIAKNENSDYRVWLNHAQNYDEGERLIFIKDVRTQTGIGLKEAKELMEKIWKDLGRRV